MDNRELLFNPQIENVSRMISFAEETGCKLIIAHISAVKGGRPCCAGTKEGHWRLL